MTDKAYEKNCVKIGNRFGDEHPDVNSLASLRVEDVEISYKRMPRNFK